MNGIRRKPLLPPLPLDKAVAHLRLWLESMEKHNYKTEHVRAIQAVLAYIDSHESTAATMSKYIERRQNGTR